MDQLTKGFSNFVGQATQYSGFQKLAETEENNLDKHRDALERWMKDFMRGLYKDPTTGIEKEEVKFEEIYKYCRNDYGIFVSRTTLWNQLLKIGRDRATSMTGSDFDSRSERFCKSEISNETLQFLYYMYRSGLASHQMNLLPEFFSGGHDAREQIKLKFIQNRLIDCCCYLILLILFTLLSFGSVNMPEGSDKAFFDVTSFSRTCFAISLFGFGFYGASVLQSPFVSKNWCSVAVNMLLLIFAVVGVICSATYLVPSYWRGSGCFECPECGSAQPDEFCWDYKELHSYIVNPKDADGNVLVQRDYCRCSLKPDVAKKIFGAAPKNKGLCDDRNKNAGKAECYYYAEDSTWMFWIGGMLICIFMFEFCIGTWTFVNWLTEYVECCNRKATMGYRYEGDNRIPISRKEIAAIRFPSIVDQTKELQKIQITQKV